MNIIKAKIIGSGTPDDPYRVNLPTYSMVREITPRLPGGMFPAGAVCDIVIPADELSKDGARPDPQVLRAKYRGQPLWDRANVGTDV